MPGSGIPTQFEANERANSQPVHCYTFMRGSTIWRYTDSPIDVTLSGVVYRAASIRHSDYEKDDESAAGELAVTTSMETPIVSDLHGLLVGLPITVTIRQSHRSGVGGVTPSTVVRYKGHVTARTLSGGSCEFACASIASLLDRPLLPMVAAPTCQHRVYGPGCGVDPSLYTTTGCTIASITGRVLNVPDALLEADPYYAAGYGIIETGDAAGEQVFFAAHVGENLTLLHDPPVGLTTADTIAITAGCDGLEATCIAKFANIDYFGGFPRVPTVNPFDKAEG
jgi:uncharacterized phage protein (TIGR02218 family)